MYKLLIVDDERHIVDWLQELFEMNIDLDLEIFSCYLGQDALQIMSNNKIDILLLDIKMPGINGLDVAKRTIRNWPKCEIIFLTGHSNFDYIYDINKQTNIKYILKTEDDETIINTVKESIHKLEKDKLNAYYVNEAKTKELMNHYLLQRSILKDVMNGRSIKDTQILLRWYQYDLTFDVNHPVYILMAKLTSQRSSRFITSDPTHILKLYNMTQHILGDGFNYAILDSDPTTLLWFIQPSNLYVSSDITPSFYLKEALDEFVVTSTETLDLNCIFYLYEQSISWHSLLRTIDKISNYASSQIRKSVFQTYGKVVNDSHLMAISNLDNHSSDNDTSIIILITQFNTALYQGEELILYNTLDSILKSSTHLKSMHNLEMIEIYQSITLHLISYIRKLNLNAKLSQNIAIYPLYFINNFDSWETAFEYLKSIIKNIFIYSVKNDQNQINRLIYQIKIYINNHYNQTITLNDLSHHFNYNSSYISRLFKKITSTKLSDYITQIKIKKAMELLETTEKNVDVIAKEIGYENTKYFFQVFKKITGTTPKDYQQTHQKNI